MFDNFMTFRKAYEVGNEWASVSMLTDNFRFHYQNIKAVRYMWLVSFFRWQLWCRATCCDTQKQSRGWWQDTSLNVRPLL